MIYTFVDYGNHTIFDADGEQTKAFIISGINPDEKDEEKTVVTVHEDKRHSYQEGDYVVFREVQGMEEINKIEPAEVVECRAYDFKIKLNSTKFGPY
jgi:ubiquitin-activating enzyme E1